MLFETSFLLIFVTTFDNIFPSKMVVSHLSMQRFSAISTINLFLLFAYQYRRLNFIPNSRVKTFKG